MDVFWVFPAVLLFIVVIVVTAIVYERKRTAALQAFAEERGLEFVPKADASEWGALKHFRIFSSGHSHAVSNLVRGDTQEVQLQIFDLRYTTGSGKNSTQHQFTIAAFTGDTLKLPRFLLRPETFLDKIGLSFDGKDINFDDRPEFSRRYVLTGERPNVIRSLFQPSVTEFCQSQPNYYAEGFHQQLLICVYRQRVVPREYPEFFRKSFEFYTLIRDALQNLESASQSDEGDTSANEVVGESGRDDADRGRDGEFREETRREDEY